MKFRGILVPFIVSIAQQMTKIGRLGFDTVTKRLIYRAEEGANGIKTLATTEDLQGLGGNSSFVRYVGEEIITHSPTPPSSHWLPLNGGKYLKSQYPALYAIYGDNFNPNGTAEEFGVPDVTGRYVLIAADIDYTYGSGGSETNQLTENNIHKITPKVRAFDGPADVPSPNFPAITMDVAGSSEFLAYAMQDNSQIDIITPIGQDNPEPYLPKYFARYAYVYAGAPQ